MKKYSQYLNRDSVSVFLLHGVISKQKWKVRNATRKHILASEFKSFCKDLRNKGEAIGIGSVLSTVNGADSFPRKAFCLTFDDGFENNYTIAADILDDLKIPCTFYITTGFIGTDEVSWTDRIERVLEASNTAVAPRISLMRDLRTLLKASKEIDPVAFAQRFEKSFNLPILKERELDAKLNWKQVKELPGSGLFTRSGLFTIGGHGHTHRILSFLSGIDLNQEISRSIALIESNTGIRIRHYSYPEGMENCWSDAVIQTLQAHGIQSAVLAYPGPNKRGTDPFRIHRIMVE